MRSVTACCTLLCPFVALMACAGCLGEAQHPAVVREDQDLQAQIQARDRLVTRLRQEMEALWAEVEKLRAQNAEAERRSRLLRESLGEMEGEIARLKGLLAAEQARTADMQRLLDEKNNLLADATKERDLFRKAYDEASNAYSNLWRKYIEASGGLPAEVTAQIEMVAREQPGLFEFNAEAGMLRFASDITFDAGSNLVKPDVQVAFGKLAVILAADMARGLFVALIAHTDAYPVKRPATITLLQELDKPPDNMGLSAARAESVARLLLSGGVEGSRVVAEGRGPTEPIASNMTPEGRARNRRLDLFLRRTPAGPKAE